MNKELDARVAKARGWHWDDDWGCLIPPEQKAKPSEMWTGWHRDNDDDDLHRHPVPGTAINRIMYNGDFSKIFLPEYSSDISAAWQVVEWVRPTFKVELSMSESGWYCHYISRASDDGVWTRIEAPTAHEAICLAFLAAQ